VQEHYQPNPHESHQKHSAHNSQHAPDTALTPGDGLDNLAVVHQVQVHPRRVEIHRTHIVAVQGTEHLRQILAKDQLITLHALRGHHALGEVELAHQLVAPLLLLLGGGFAGERLVAALSLATALPTPATPADLTGSPAEDGDSFLGFPPPEERKQWSNKLVGKYYLGKGMVAPDGMKRDQMVLPEDLPKPFRALHSYDMRSMEFIPSRMDLNLVDHSQIVQSVTWG